MRGCVGECACSDPACLIRGSGEVNYVHIQMQVVGFSTANNVFRLFACFVIVLL